MTDEIMITVPTAEDFAELHRAVSAAFNEESTRKRRGRALTFEPERFLVARRDGEIVGTAGIYTRALTVPGAVVPGRPCDGRLGRADRAPAGDPHPLHAPAVRRHPGGRRVGGRPVGERGSDLPAVRLRPGRRAGSSSRSRPTRWR